MQSARRIWPEIFSVTGTPASIVDIGCGQGSWLAALQQIAPNADCIGVDHPGADQVFLMARDRFVGADLTKPLDLKRKFDMCISLEVAEHIVPNSAETFIDTLTRHADCIVFSAAIPGQAGTNHVNLQWPAYWISLFSARGYECHDVIRPKIWKDAEVAYWYRQNILLFAKHGTLDSSQHSDWGGNDLVHPELFQQFCRSVSARTPRNLYRFLRGSLGTDPSG